MIVVSNHCMCQHLDEAPFSIKKFKRSKKGLQETTELQTPAYIFRNLLLCFAKAFFLYYFLAWNPFLCLLCSMVFTSLQIKNLGTKSCLDTFGQHEKQGSKPGLYTCHGLGNNQVCLYTSSCFLHTVMLWCFKE